MRKQFKFVGKDGYSANLCGNYFTKDQVTDYLPIVEKFPDYFEEVIEVEQVNVESAINLLVNDIKDKYATELLVDVVENKSELVEGINVDPITEIHVDSEEDVVEKLDDEQDDEQDETAESKLSSDEEPKSEKKKVGRKPKGK